MSVVAYLRVSTDRQDAENQRRDVESLGEVVDEWVVEYGSAWKKDGLNDRPEFKRVRDLIFKGVVKKLLVWDIDRLYRRRKACVDFLRLCKDRGCVVLSYRQKYLSEVERAPSPWNEIIYDLIIQVLSSIAEEESSKKSDRVKAAFVNSKHPEKWGRPKAKFNQRRAYYLLFEECLSLREVASAVGTSLATIQRFKKVNEKKGLSFINDV